MTDTPENHETAPIDRTQGTTEDTTEGTIAGEGSMTAGDSPSTVRSVPYKGADLDSERGPGLGCFRFQVILLATLVLLTPIGVNAGWPDWLTATLLFLTIALLLVTGQTIIFLLRLVAADRRGRRRPLASGTRTVGELEDAEQPPTSSTEQVLAPTAEQPPAQTAEQSADGGDGGSAMRQ
ncbi:MAG TPA: hypothetical protein VK656_00040 [Candidatus Acidoferrum sp.]|nr:hypothetical protein [Candidatus Acidoferrum sp.]